jgi:hypothetical protein
MISNDHNTINNISKMKEADVYLPEQLDDECSRLEFITIIK